MTTQREYLVALAVRSTLHAWIAAPSEDHAITKAEDLYTEGEGNFIAKGGTLDSVVVLEQLVAQRKKFRIAFEQPPVHTIIVEAVDLDAAIRMAEEAFLEEPGFFPEDPPAGWQRRFNDWDIVEAEEVQP